MIFQKKLEAERKLLKLQYIEIQEEIESLSSIEMFGINDNEDSFGHYLKDSGRSGYLQLLQRRVTYISNKSRSQSCAIKSHFQF